MSEKLYVTDYPEENPVQLEIYGNFLTIGNKAYFVLDSFDVDNVGELVMACGYTVDSIAGKPLKITIEEDE